MFNYDSEEYFTHGTATVDAIEKILEPERIVWADWVKDTQGFVYYDPTEDDRPVLFEVEQIVEKSKPKSTKIPMCSTSSKKTKSTRSICGCKTTESSLSRRYDNGTRALFGFAWAFDLSLCGLYQIHPQNQKLQQNCQK